MTFYLIYENGIALGNAMLYEDALKKMMELKEKNPEKEYVLKERYY